MGQGSSKWDIPSPAPSRDSGIGTKRYMCMPSINARPIVRLSHFSSTPLPTPTHKYNAWVSGRKSMGITPLVRGQEEEEGGGGGKEPMQFKNEAEREEWEEEQKVPSKIHF